MSTKPERIQQRTPLHICLCACQPLYRHAWCLHRRCRM